MQKIKLNSAAKLLGFLKINFMWVLDVIYIKLEEMSLCLQSTI